MGNPHVHFPEEARPVVASQSANGVLAWIGGHLIAAAADQLPRAGPGLDSPREVVATGVERFAAVRITFELASHRHGRTRLWSWRPLRADPVMLELQVRPVRWLDDYWAPAARV